MYQNIRLVFHFSRAFLFLERIHLPVHKFYSRNLKCYNWFNLLGSSMKLIDNHDLNFSLKKNLNLLVSTSCQYLLTNKLEDIALLLHTQMLTCTHTHTDFKFLYTNCHKMIGFTRLIPRYHIFINIMTCVYTLVSISAVLHGFGRRQWKRTNERYQWRKANI